MECKFLFELQINSLIIVRSHEHLYHAESKRSPQELNRPTRRLICSKKVSNSFKRVLLSITKNLANCFGLKGKKFCLARKFATTLQAEAGWRYNVLRSIQVKYMSCTVLMQFSCVWSQTSVIRTPKGKNYVSV